MNNEQKEFRLITDDRRLREFCGRIEKAATVAIDTEFVREKTYYPQLCLVQIACDEAIGAVDCLADLDLAQLFETLHANDRIWVLHSARQDLEVLFYLTEQSPSGLIDTQIAAALVGFPLQIGLKGLAKEVLDIDIAKEHTRTDWSRRPLPEAALDYALDDVRYLPALWAELRRRLNDLERLTWFEEDCDRLLKLPVQPPVASILERTKGAGALRGKRRAAALALLDWREAKAQSKNLQRRWILPDDQLVAIASRLPTTPADLDSIPDLPQRLKSRHGKSLLAALEAAPLPGADPASASSPDKTVVKAMQASVRARAEALGIESEVLATRRDISAAAQGLTPDAFASGWRSVLLADLVNPAD